MACVDRLLALGPYEFNASSGETLQLQSSAWVDGPEITSWLKSLPADASPGDVYARLKAG